MSGDVELNGSVWNHYPVNKKFVESYGDDIKSLSSTSAFIMYDLAKNPEIEYYHSTTDNRRLFRDWYDYYGTKINMVEYVYKPMDDTDIAMKPEFVTKAGWESFSDKDRCSYLYNLFFKPKSGSGNDGKFYYPTNDIDEYGEVIPRGFYYVTTKEHLLWCAEKVNNTSYDNEINIVLGDNIGYDSSTSIIKTPIGINPAQPFNGVFFGNGFGFLNIELECNNDVNGIIGYLGRDGVIDHVWVKNCRLICNKPLSITHIANGNFDIAAGFICGKNDGIIRNVYISKNIGFKDFVPRLYSVANKSDNDPDTKALSNPGSNFYYPDYMCYNSLGNIIPYIGYFNEGVFATYSGYSKVTNKEYTYWNTEYCNNGYIVKEPDGENTSSPHEWYYWNGVRYTDSNNSNYAGYLFSYTAPANRKNILWYDANIVENVFKKVRGADANSLGVGAGKDPGVLLIQPDNFSQNFKDIEYAQYFNKSMKMNQQNRAAYYVSPLVGINSGKIHDSFVDADLTLSGTFVGFAGGLAGKQSKGEVSGCKVNIVVHDEILSGAPVRDYLRTTDNPVAKDNYYFEKKSIKNIGGLFGSLVVGDGNGLNILAVDSYFNNKMNIVRDNNEIDVYKDYYFNNRFGGFAAIVEYNSCNISDIWLYNSKIAAKYSNKSEYGPGIDFVGGTDRDVNDTTGILRSIKVTNSTIRYAENKDENITLKHYTIKELTNNSQNENYQYGVSSPIFGEIKPTYLSVPSIISSPFHNTTKDNGSREDGTSEKLGLFYMDQQLAAPKSDYPYWSINTEVDLPGISNGNGLWAFDSDGYAYGWKGEGYAGGVIDCINATSAVNFDLDVKSIAKTLVKWQNSSIYTMDSDNCFETVTVPSASIFELSRGNLHKEVITTTTGNIPYVSENPEGRAFNIGFDGIDDIQGIDLTLDNMPSPGVNQAYDFKLIKNTKLNNFDANKRFMQYPYFGSDIIIEPTIATNDNKARDTFDLQNLDFDYVEIIYSHASYYGERGGVDGEAKLGVYYVKIRIYKDAFNKAPFTNVATNIAEIDRNYEVYVKADSDGSYSHDDGDIQINEYCGTRLWRRSDEHEGTYANGISVLADYYDSDEESTIKNWLDNNAFGARYGWYFYSDDDDGETYAEYMNAAILFDFTPYNGTRTNGISPPNFPFCIIYVGGQKKNRHEYDGDTMNWYGGANREAKALSICDSVKFYKNNQEMHLTSDQYWATHPKWFSELNTRGYFHNGLVKSRGGSVDGVTQYSNPTKINITNTDWFGYMSSDSKFSQIATQAMSNNSNEYSTYFKYTYMKNVMHRNDISGAGTADYKWNVKYDHMNGRAGFWVQNNAAKESNDEYNDKITYTQNYMTFGKTLNERCILSYLNKSKANRENGCHVTGFSADDFEGIYVTDSADNPVMYIDAGMGECSEGTSWSYECYSGSHTNYKDDVYGLLLEVNTDIPGLKETEEDV